MIVKVYLPQVIMAKPKPPTPEARARRKAEAALPKLQRRLKKLLAGNAQDEEGESEDTGESEDEVKAEEDEDEEDEDEVEGNMEDEMEAEMEAETDGLVDDEEDEEEEGSDEEDYEYKDYNYQNEHILPDQYHIEIEGVCVVTDDLIRETLATYNEDAVDWIKLHLCGQFWCPTGPSYEMKSLLLSIIHHPDVTTQGAEAADIAYPWIQATLATHYEFELQAGQLSSRFHHSFPKSLLANSDGDLFSFDGDLFKRLHAIIFSTHSDLAQCYVDAAQAKDYIPPASIKRCLKKVENSPGIYAFNINTKDTQNFYINTDDTQKFYIGRSKDMQKRLSAHLDRKVPGVNAVIRAAKTTSTPTAWTRGAVVTLGSDFGHVPTGIWSAFETSLIACHGSTVKKTGQSQMNIVDICRLPRPRTTRGELESMFEDFIA